MEYENRRAKSPRGGSLRQQSARQSRMLSAVANELVQAVEETQTPSSISRIGKFMNIDGHLLQWAASKDMQALKSICKTGNSIAGLLLAHTVHLNKEKEERQLYLLLEKWKSCQLAHDGETGSASGLSFVNLSKTCRLSLYSCHGLSYAGCGFNAVLSGKVARLSHSFGFGSCILMPLRAERQLGGSICGAGKEVVAASPSAWSSARALGIGTAGHRGRSKRPCVSLSPSESFIVFECEQTCVCGASAASSSEQISRANVDVDAAETVEIKKLILRTLIALYKRDEQTSHQTIQPERRRAAEVSSDGARNPEDADDNDDQKVKLSDPSQWGWVDLWQLVIDPRGLEGFNRTCLHIFALTILVYENKVCIKECGKRMHGCASYIVRAVAREQESTACGVATVHRAASCAQPPDSPAMLHINDRGELPSERTRQAILSPWTYGLYQKLCSALQLTPDGEPLVDTKSLLDQLRRRQDRSPTTAQRELPGQDAQQTQHSCQAAGKSVRGASSDSRINRHRRRQTGPATLDACPSILIQRDDDGAHETLKRRKKPRSSSQRVCVSSLRRRSPLESPNAAAQAGEA
ncbi:hypothetical protein BESB_063760 [Besnoitia besnoiti]|uniref:Nse4 n=1 Tax=Besnoitia besnoiti TaxID=94643 RepID=A0A2A9MC92_BESBE|nr:hypothetical protein BESB_063760 [Besnoitia besnoiti]PFH35489.1 hypothetical protein BESB_063760 [Besnoitia besnoiti]